MIGLEVLYQAYFDPLPDKYVGASSNFHLFDRLWSRYLYPTR